VRSGILFFFAFAITWADFTVRAEEKVSIEWQEEVMDAWKKAVHEKRPLLVYVAMDGCAFCRKLEKDTLSSPQIAEMVGSGFVAAKLDGPKDPKLAKRLGVRAYPTLVIISPENKVLDSISGYVEADELINRLDSAAKTLEVAVASATTEATTVSGDMKN
jgi:thioredoxin-related protein